MRKILLGSLILSGFLYANSTEIFPDVLSSESVINFYSSVEIKESGEDLVTPKMNNKNKAKCGAFLRSKFCVASGESPKSLKEFNFLNSNVNESIEVDSDITLNSENIGNIVITKDNLTITFDAPSVDGLFSRTQKIASIIDEGKNTTFIFKAGDYYIGNFEVISQSSKKKVVHDRVEIKTEGNSRFFIKDKFEINKNINSNPKDDVIVINKDKSSKELMIYSLGDINFNTTASFNINALVYSFANFDIIGSPQSSFSGAIHSKDELNIGDKKSIGEFIYDTEAVSELYSNGITLVSLPEDPKDEGKKTLEGIDNNRNGIRDDVEIFLYQNALESPSVNMTYMEKAKIFPTVILTEFNAPTREENQKKALEVDIELEKIMDCQEAILLKKYGFDNSDAYDDDFALTIKLQRAMFNTEERVKLYMKYNGLLSGTIGVNYYGTDEIEVCCQEFPTVLESAREEGLIGGIK